MTRTALVRTSEGNLKIIRTPGYTSQKEFAIDLRGNGYRVLHIWNGNVKDNIVDEWEYLNRK